MSDEPLHFERDDLALTDVAVEPWALTLTRGKTGVALSLADLRWLVLAAGPAALCALAPPRPIEADAGDGGGPSPAAADGTGPPDGQLDLDVTSEPAGDSPLG